MKENLAFILALFIWQICDILFLTQMTDWFFSTAYMVDSLVIDLTHI